jgi:hypothetical protein
MTRTNSTNSTNSTISYYSTVGNTRYSHTHTLATLKIAYSMFCTRYNIRPKFTQREIKKGSEAEKEIRELIKNTIYDY